MYREPNLRLGSNDDTCLVFFASYEKHALSIYIFSIFKPQFSFSLFSLSSPLDIQFGTGSS